MCVCERLWPLFLLQSGSLQWTRPTDSLVTLTLVLLTGAMCVFLPTSLYDSGSNGYVCVLGWGNHMNMPILHASRRRSQWLHLNVALSIVLDAYLVQWCGFRASVHWIMGALFPDQGGATVFRSKKLEAERMKYSNPMYQQSPSSSECSDLNYHSNIL